MTLPKLLTASEVLYMEDGDVKRCDRCMMFLTDVRRCAIHGPDVPVQPDMVCGLYVRGTTTTEAEHGPPLPLVTPSISGLGRGNTNCGNCRFGRGPTCRHPALSGFAIDQTGGCCNAWTAPSMKGSTIATGHSS